MFIFLRNCAQAPVADPETRQVGARKCEIYANGGSRISQGKGRHQLPTGVHQAINFANYLPRTAWKWKSLDREGSTCPYGSATVCSCLWGLSFSRIIFIGTRGPLLAPLSPSLFSNSRNRLSIKVDSLRFNVLVALSVVWILHCSCEAPLTALSLVLFLACQGLSVINRRHNNLISSNIT